MIDSPDDIIRQLGEIRTEAAKGVTAQFDAEVKMAEAELAAETAEAKALLNAGGTVAERQAVAKIQTEELQLAAAIAKAEYNRVKTKLRHLDAAQSSLQTAARMLEVTWRTAGVGER
jgi:hypothetical protein